MLRKLLGHLRVRVERLPTMYVLMLLIMRSALESALVLLEQRTAGVVRCREQKLLLHVGHVLLVVRYDVGLVDKGLDVELLAKRWADKSLLTSNAAAVSTVHAQLLLLLHEVHVLHVELLLLCCPLLLELEIRQKLCLERVNYVVLRAN